MLKKIFKPIQMGGATVVIAVTSFLSYGIGLIRDRIIAINFGTTSATDTYNASFLIPDILFNLFIAGALAAAFLPIFSNYLEKDKKQAFELANSVLTGAVLLIGLLALIAFIFMESIIGQLFSEAIPTMQKDITNMTRLMLGSAILFAISNTLGNILMSYKHFIAYSLSPVLYNLGIIFGVIFLQEKFGIYSAAIGVLIGVIFHCLIRIIDTFATEYEYKPQFNFKHPGLKKIIKLMIPRTIGLIMWQINTYIFAVVGIKLIEGGFAAFNYARNIQSFAVSLFGIAFATAVFPYLSTAASQSNQKAYTDYMQKTMQRILFFTIPAAAGVMLLPQELVELILSGGVFDERAVQLTSVLLFFFAISIPFESLSHIIARGFYALHNTLTPTLINIVIMILIAFATIVLAPKYGIKWFSIGFSGGFAIYVILLLIALKKNLKTFDIKTFLISVLKTLAATAFMALILIYSKQYEHHFTQNIAHILRILIGGMSFFVAAYILKSSEISSISYILNRLAKKG